MQLELRTNFTRDGGGGGRRRKQQGGAAGAAVEAGRASTIKSEGRPPFNRRPLECDTGQGLNVEGRVLKGLKVIGSRDSGVGLTLY